MSIYAGKNFGRFLPPAQTHPALPSSPPLGDGKIVKRPESTPWHSPEYSNYCDYCGYAATDGCDLVLGIGGFGLGGAIAATNEQ